MLNVKREFPFEDEENRPFKKRSVNPEDVWNRPSDGNDKGRKAGNSLTGGPSHYDVPIQKKNLQKMKWKLKLAGSYLDEALALGKDLEEKYVEEITAGKGFINVFIQEARAPNEDVPLDFEEEEKREAPTSEFIKEENGEGATPATVKLEKEKAVPLLTVKEEQVPVTGLGPMLPRAPMLPPLESVRFSRNRCISGQEDTPLAPEKDPNMLTNQQALDMIAVLEEVGRRYASKETLHRPEHFTIPRNGDSGESSIFLPNDGRNPKFLDPNKWDWLSRTARKRLFNLLKSGRNKPPVQFSCQVCEEDVNFKDLWTHPSTLRHKTMLKRGGRDLSERVKTKMRLVCTLCSVEVTKPKHMDKHLKGKKHKKKAKQEGVESWPENKFVERGE